MTHATTTGEGIATAMRMRLAELNRSQRWLADSIDRSTYWVSRRLSGNVPMTTDDIDAIAHAMGIDTFDLLLHYSAANRKSVA